MSWALGTLIPRCLAQAWEVHALLATGIASGEVVPLPLNRFARKDAGNAFRFMAAGTSPSPQVLPDQQAATQAYVTVFPVLQTGTTTCRHALTHSVVFLELRWFFVGYRNPHGQGADPDGS